MSLKSNVWTTQAGTVYLKQFGSFGRYIWGGRRMRMEEIQNNNGNVSTTTKQNPRGGIERDSLLQDVPTEVTTSIIMKHVQFENMKSELLYGFWSVDKRMMDDGRDRDAPLEAKEIYRLILGKSTQRTDSPTTWEGEEEGMITFPMTFLNAYDIQMDINYGEATLAGYAASIADVRAGGFAQSSQDETIIYAIGANPTAADTALFVNENFGALNGWVAKAFTGETEDGSSVLGFGKFVLMSFASKLKRSDDKGDTSVDITHADWAANAPAYLDGVDQSFIVLCGANGYVWNSFDGGRTWSQSTAGEVTTENLNKIRINRDLPNVIWAVGANSAIIKTENSGLSWYTITPPIASKNILDIHVESADSVMILTEDGIVYTTIDSGISWSQQGAMVGVTGTYVQGSIMGSPADVFFCSLVATGLASTLLFRNTEGGADGYWVPVQGSSGAVNVGAMAVVNQNLAIVAGGSTAEDDNVVGIIG